METFERELTERLGDAANTIDVTDGWDAVLADAFPAAPQSRRLSNVLLTAAVILIIAGIGWMSFGRHSQVHTTPAADADAEPTNPLAAPMGPEPLFDTSTLGAHQPAFDRSNIDGLLSSGKDIVADLIRDAGENNDLGLIRVLGDRDGMWSLTYNKVGRGARCHLIRLPNATTSEHCNDQAAESDVVVGFIQVGEGTDDTYGWTQVEPWVSVVTWKQDGLSYWQRPVGGVALVRGTNGPRPLPELQLLDADGNHMGTVNGPGTLSDLLAVLPGETVLQAEPLVVLAAFGPAPDFDTSTLGEEHVGFVRPSPGDDVAALTLPSTSRVEPETTGHLKLSIAGSIDGRLNGSSVRLTLGSGDLIWCTDAGSSEGAIFACDDTYTSLSSSWFDVSGGRRDEGDYLLVGVGPAVSVIGWEVSGERFWQRPIDGRAAIYVGDAANSELKSFTLYRTDGQTITRSGPTLADLQQRMPYVPVVLDGETVLQEDPLVVLAAQGPEPGFDPTTLGDEVVVLDRNNVDARFAVAATTSGFSEVTEIYKVTVQGRVDGSYALNFEANSTDQAEPGSSPPAVSYHRQLSDGRGGFSSSSQEPFTAPNDKVVSIAPGPGRHIWLDVPANTSIVGLEVGQTKTWQRPSGGLAVFERQLAVGQTAHVTAYASNGSIIASLNVDPDEEVSTETEATWFEPGEPLGAIRGYDRDSDLAAIEPLGEPVVFLFGAEWCTTCFAELADVLAELPEVGETRYVFVGDVGNAQGLPSLNFWPYEAISPGRSGPLQVVDGAGSAFPVPSVLVVNGDREVVGFVEGYRLDLIAELLSQAH